MPPKTPQYLKPTMASRKRLENSKTPPIPTPPASVEPVSTSRSTISTPPSGATASAHNKNKSVKATERGFRQAVLERHGIDIRVRDDLRSPYTHFGTPDPNRDVTFSQNMPAWYQTKHQHQDCKVWLNLQRTEAEDVAIEYQALNRLKENEAAYSYHGKSSFLKMDKRILPESDLRVNTTYFKLEWGPTPDDRNLHFPPQLYGPDLSQAPFAFNTKPDCTYWLTLCRMNPTYRNRVPRLTYTLPHIQAVTPYLTIEFKRDDQDYEIAENQLAAAVALILYNRVRLRCKRLLACSTPQSDWKAEHFADIKHYCIGFSGSQARIYVAHPSLEFVDGADGEIAAARAREEAITENFVNLIWRGSCLDDFTTLDAQTVDGVLNLQQWINEIHCWGLGKHSEQVVLDIKGILVQHEGGLDRVSLNRDDLVAWGLAPTSPEESFADGTAAV